MAQRPVFEARTEGSTFVKYHSVQFRWNAQRDEGDSIADTFISRAHHRFSNPVLDLSSSSNHELAKKVSAHQLTLNVNGKDEKVLSLFDQSRLALPESQAGEKFKIQDKAYEYEGEFWPSWPRSALYDYLCVQALVQHEDLHDQLLTYQFFADLRDVRPEQRINHAGSVALFVSLKSRGLLHTALASQQNFLKYCK